MLQGLTQSPFPGERFDLHSFPGMGDKEGQQMPLLSSWENIIDSHSCVSEIRTCSSKLRPEFSSHCTEQSPQPCPCSGSFSKGSAHSCRSLKSLSKDPSPLQRHQDGAEQKLKLWLTLNPGFIPQEMIEGCKMLFPLMLLAGKTWQ